MRIFSFIALFACLTLSVTAEPITDAMYRPVDPAEAALGQKLFYDPILSGNRNISCATCHHPKFATGDGVSLSLGEGGIGLGPERRVDPQNVPEQRIPRHAQALFNLGAKEFTVLFHDGRIEVDAAKPSGFRTPLDDEMLDGFASLLSAQTMFPVLSADEMAGHIRENDISKLVRSGRITGPDGAWAKLSKRVGDVPEYLSEFRSVYPKVKVASDIKFTDISNAIAAFIELEWRSDTSPYDAFLRTGKPLSKPAERGRVLFSEICSSCHAGPFQTDHRFHATGLVQFGPGKAASFERHARDTGRMRVTGDEKDRFAFRTPSLRNVAHTSPYGHTGAYPTLEMFLEAHLDPQKALARFDRSRVILPAFEVDDWWVMDRHEEVAAIAESVTTAPIQIDPQQIDDIIAFLESLSDPIALRGRLGIPETVPSGLPIEN